MTLVCGASSDMALYRSTLSSIKCGGGTMHGVVSLFCGASGEHFSAFVGSRPGVGQKKKEMKKTKMKAMY
jgi:hypothetical protein